MRIIQQELNLFQPPSFEEIIKACNISKLTITFNKRLRKSWHLKKKKLEDTVWNYPDKQGLIVTQKRVINP